MALQVEFAGRLLVPADDFSRVPVGGTTPGEYLAHVGVFPPPLAGNPATPRLEDGGFPLPGCLNGARIPGLSAPPPFPPLNSSEGPEIAHPRGPALCVSFGAARAGANVDHRTRSTLVDMRINQFTSFAPPYTDPSHATRLAPHLAQPVRLD